MRLFEFGPVFRKDGVEEQTALALVATGGDSDLYELKGVLRAAFGPVDFAPEAGLALRVSGCGVDGIVRRLPRALAEAHDAKDAVYFAEVVIDGWLGKSPAEVRVQPLPKFPAVERDLSLVLPRAVT
ncbi:MAG: hypothetical protein ACK55I_23215, partial [bacterium]